MERKFAVVGGTGQMGRIVVKDLFESDKRNHILVIGRDLKKLQELKKQYSSDRIHIKPASVEKPTELARVIRGSSVLINCVQYELNLLVMQAALKAKVHYLDLGGLFHMTRKQLKLDKEFKKIKRLAILGIGAAPGITNLLAKLGAEQLDVVKEIHIRVGTWDGTKIIQPSPLSSSYSFQTILEEFTERPAVFTQGLWRFVEPMSGFEKIVFPKPVGIRYPMYTLHSEIATLPTSFKGVQEVTFKIAFDQDFIKTVKLLLGLGLTTNQLLKLASELPKPKRGKPREYEILRAIVKGMKNGKQKTVTVDCHVSGMPTWNLGIDTDTGVPPSVAAQMIVQNEIRAIGVWPPEQCIEPRTFFQKLVSRNMVIQTK